MFDSTNSIHNIQGLMCQANVNGEFRVVPQVLLLRLRPGGCHAVLVEDLVTAGLERCL